jgi:hypothetical protein
MSSSSENNEINANTDALTKVEDVVLQIAELDTSIQNALKKESNAVMPDVPTTATAAPAGEGSLLPLPTANASAMFEDWLLLQAAGESAAMYATKVISVCLHRCDQKELSTVH